MNSRDLGHRSDRPLYLHITDRLRTSVLVGEIAPGKRLPSEHSMMKQYHASRDTVRKAVAVLRAEGRLDAERGRGVFVRAQVPGERRASDRLVQRHWRGGKVTLQCFPEATNRISTFEIQIKKELATGEIASRLELVESEEVLIQCRRIMADEIPLRLETSYLPLKLLHGSQIGEIDVAGPNGIYARLEEMGYRLGKFEERVTARMPLPDEIQALNLRPGTPVILIARTAYAKIENRPIELCDTVMTADRYELVYEVPVNDVSDYQTSRCGKGF